MKKEITDRVIKEANYMLETNNTIRDVAKIFNVSKSTVHKDLKERLPLIDPLLYHNISDIITTHLEQRHIKGGESTKSKFAK